MSSLEQARRVLEAAARFDPRRRPPVLALVKFRARDGRRHEVLVHANDWRELKELRQILKHVNQRVTVVRLNAVSVSAAKRLAWVELAHLGRRDWRGLAAHPEALEAISGARG